MSAPGEKSASAGGSAASNAAATRTASPSKLPPNLAFARSTQSLDRMSAKRLEEREERMKEQVQVRAVDPGLRESDDVAILKTKLRHKYRTIAAGWREGLDLRGKHSVGEADWFKALRTLGFGGNARAAWAALSGSKKRVTLADLDPNAARLLSGFYQAYAREIGKLQDMLAELDGLRASETCFLQRCAPLKKSSVFRREPVHLQGVFANLQSSPGAITEHDLQWLDDYCTRDQKVQKVRVGLMGAAEQAAKSAQTAAEAKAEEEGRELPAPRAQLKAAAERRQGLREFQRVLSHRCGGLVPAWRRILDREGNGAVALEDFEFVVEAIEFESPAQDLWEELVGPDGDALTLKEWCPQGEAVLHEFKHRCVECFGSMSAAFEEVKGSKKPLLSREEWARFCGEIRLRSNHNLLLDYLDTRGTGFVVLSSVDIKTATSVFGVKTLSTAQEEYLEMDALPKKAPHVTIKERAVEQCGDNARPPEDLRQFREELLEVLERRWESPIRAWGAVLDPTNKGKLTKDEFFVGCSVAGFAGSKSSLWKELGLKDTQCVRLKDLASEALEECVEFKRLSGKQLGRMITAMEAAGGTGTKKNGAELDLKDFKDLCTRIGYRGDSATLMKHFDPAGKGTVNSKNLRFFHEEKKEEKAILGLVKKHYSLQRELWQQKLETVKMANASELLVRQGELMKLARTKRDEKVEPENERRLLLSKLSRKFGSIARAWKRALNPSDTPELSFNFFVDGCKRAGVLQARPEDEELNRYQRLFNYLIAGDAEASGLKLSHLDPRIEEHIDEFKVRCCERFGSIWHAFDKFDPTGTGAISTDTFKLLCQEIKVTDGVHRMCHFFDPDSEHEIQLESIDKDAADDAKDACEERREAVQSKLRRDKRLKREHMAVKPPRDMAAQAKEDADTEKMLKSMRLTFVKKYGTAARAWRTAFDASVDEAIDFDNFESGLAEAGVDTEAADLWQALGREFFDHTEKQKKTRGQPKHKLSLIQLEPSYEAELKEIGTRIIQRWGSYLSCFKELVAEGADKLMLDPKGFKILCHECQYRLNVQRLFDLFSVDGKRVHFKMLNKEAADAVKKLQAGKGIVDEDNKGEDTSDEDDDHDEGEDADEESGSSPSSPSVPQLLRADPAEAFREVMARRFGSSLKAWRVLDPERRGALRLSEFKKSVPSTGYSGGPTIVFKALMAELVKPPTEPKSPFSKEADYMAALEETELTIREVDPALFDRLSSFRRCCFRVYPKLSKIFQDTELTKNGQLTEEQFQKLCKKVGTPKSEQLFDELAVKQQVGPAEVKFMEDWVTQDGQERPKRLPPKAPSSPSFKETFPSRSLGSGPLVTWMKPRPVSFTKSSSLPALTRVKPQWNGRHAIPEHAGNKDENVLYVANYVKTQHRDRVKLRIARKMKEVSTLQWLAENYPREDRDYVGDDDDNDD